MRELLRLAMDITNMNRVNRYEIYRDYLQSDHWNELRTRKKNESGRFCQNCKSTHALHVHHIRYRNLTDVITSDLCVLCEQCHSLFHKACRKNGVDYVGMELDSIIKTITEFSLTRKHKKPKLKHLKKNCIVHYFSRFKRSKRTHEDMEEMLNGIRDYVTRFLVDNNPKINP